MALKIGDIIDGKYRIVRLLGEGGMGAVFEGENTRIHRRVAIKVLHAGVASNQDAVQRFEREAQAAGRIGSEHIVEVLDLGILPEGDRYMVMEFLEGESLNQRIATRGKLSAQTTAAIVVDVLEGLSAAHDAGIIHRDLKPDNIFLLNTRGGKKDFVKIVDFGISKFNVLGGGSEFSMTRTGAVMGTPYYMSPEQAKGNRDVDHRADLYAMGVMLYECIAGEVPFNAETFNELLFKIVLEQATPLVERVPDCDPSFSALVAKAMARDPADRFQTAGALQAALRSWLAGQPFVPETTANYGTPTGLDRTQVPNPAPTGAKTGMATPAVPPNTQGTWANTGEFGANGPKNSKVMLFAAAAAVVVFAGAGLAFFQKNAESGRAQAAQAAEEAKLQAERAEFEKTKAEAEAKAALALVEAEKAKLLAEAKAKAEKETREEKASDGTAAPLPSPRPGSKPTRPSAPVSTQPAPASSPAPSGGGRKIRTDL